MAIRKTTAALSLAVLISFGVSGCEGSFSIGNGEPTQTQTATPSESTKAAETGTEEVREQAAKTLNELRDFSRSEAFDAFSNEMSAIEGDDKEAMPKIEAILDKHKPVQDELKEKLGLTPEAMRGYQGIFAMSNSNMETPYSEKFINSAIYFSALGDVIGIYEAETEDISFDVTSNAVSEKDGEFELNSYGIYIKDKNNAVVEFPETAFASYGLEDGGRKIIIEEVTGDSRDEEPSYNGQLESDVKNAATTIETWIVYQGGKVIPLVVEDGKIVSGKTDKGDPLFKISDNVNLEFEGDSNSYVITGTDKTTGAEVIYDSAKGGLKETKKAVQAVDKDSVKYDAKAFQKYQAGFSKEDFKNLSEYVDYLNGAEYGSDANFEVVDKNGIEYVKVSDPNTKIMGKELIYVSPFK